MRNQEKVVLVDHSDNYVGTMGKLEAHKKGLLHRAFSLFIFNHRGELLLQQRAKHKYHSGGLWTNTCCSHPRPNESPEEAAHRRLYEEMGFDCPLEFSFSFIYESELDNQLIEHEFDHVFIGRYDDKPDINPDEVMNWKYVDLKSINNDLMLHPHYYTVWFRIALQKSKHYFPQDVVIP